MATLTRSAIRRLTRLYRSGVEGADAQLDALISERSEYLEALLGSDLDVALLCKQPERVELLVRWVENTRRRNTEHRVRLDRERAEHLARDLAGTATRAGELLHVEPSTLMALLACKSFDYLVPDPDIPTGIERRRLHAFLRECRGAEVVDAELWPDRLRLRYRTTVGGGRLMLWHQAVPECRVVLYLPPPREVMRAAELVTDLEPTLAPTTTVTRTEEQPHSECEPALEPACVPRPRRPRTPWLRQVFELVTEALP